jgi:hypothetical protein
MKNAPTVMAHGRSVTVTCRVHVAAPEMSAVQSPPNVAAEAVMVEALETVVVNDELVHCETIDPIAVVDVKPKLGESSV